MDPPKYPSFNPPSRAPYDGFWGKAEYIWTNGYEKGWHYDINGNPTGPAPIFGMPPDIIGGPLVKGAKLLRVGKFNFNSKFFHLVFKDKLLSRVKGFEHIVGENPDIFFNGTRIFLRGRGNLKYKSFDTGLDFWDYLSTLIP